MAQPIIFGSQEDTFEGGRLIQYFYVKSVDRIVARDMFDHKYMFTYTMNKDKYWIRDPEPDFSITVTRRDSHF